ncbi:MAG: GMC family oxidoreductase, partial [Rhodobacter sp.]|nr:GMC family oxidoreductase [Rhodobacter sp.]
APQAALKGRRVPVPRGRMVGGSGAINSMVWFRGRRADFDGWGLPGWTWNDVEPVCQAIERRVQPAQMQGAHPLERALHGLFGQNDTAPPTPERESAGVFRINMARGRRRSAADALLRPAVRAARGVILSAGSVGSPAIRLRSGIGPADQLRGLGIDVVAASEAVGANLQDHPGVGLHFDGGGYGLSLAQLPGWIAAPLRWASTGRGRLASPTVEGGAFFNALGTGTVPDVQSHFIPFKLGWQGRRFVPGQGYFADVCLCRPRSRGSLRLMSKDPRAAPWIDLGLPSDPRDLELLFAGLRRLRLLLEEAEFGPRAGTEVCPGPQLSSDAQLRAYIRQRCATAYHPVGTLRMGPGDDPVDARCRVRGADALWVADASVMPAITSANTNAPSMMIGAHAAEFIARDAA